MARTVLTAAAEIIVRDLTADHGAKYYGGPMGFSRWDAVRYCTEGFVVKHPALAGITFNTLFDAVDSYLSDEILAAGPLTDEQVKDAQAARWEAGGLVHDRAALALFKAGDYDGAHRELDAGEQVSPEHMGGGRVTWAELHEHVRVKAAAVAAEAGALAELEAAGRAAYSAGGMRAPALSPLVREAIAGKPVGSPAAAAAMAAYTRGFDQAADEAAAAA